MATLTYGDLLKRNNTEIIANRIDGGSVLLKDNKSQVYKCTGKAKFVISKKAEEVKKPSKENIVSFLQNRKTTDSFLIEIKHNNKLKFVKITEVYKDKEFGGGGVGSSTAKEDAQLESLKKQIKDAILMSGTDHIIITVKNKTHKVIGAESTPGTPKSDFHLIDINNKECIWISHKDGKTAKDFQQWGGVSKKEFPNTPKDVLNFINLIKIKYGDILPTATTVAMEINDDKLKNMAVYGIDYGGKLGRQNVSVLLQGDVKLIKQRNYYLLDSYNVHYNGDKITGDFEPVLMAMYKGDRSNFGIKGARFGISPRGSRKVKYWFD